MNDIEEIKSRLDIVELAKEYMTLRPAGRNWKALCPLHQEKTPSLMITPDKQIWHCFGCAEGGDIFTLVQKMEGVDFYESLKILADKAGVALEQSDGYKKYRQVTDKLEEVNNLAAEFYHQAFMRSKTGQIARDYILKRGLDEKTISKFKIGYAPDMWEALVSFLKKRGYEEKNILESGLATRSKNGNLVDRFRQRVMFPIWDANNRVVGFTGRVLLDKDNPKYLNTAATKVFDKGKLWYGLNFAKNAIREKKVVLVCEGQMDVIACHQYGFENSVCSSGTAVSKQQLVLLKRQAEEMWLCFDNDDAGQKSAYRLTGMALDAGLIVKVVDLGKQKDPDEMIRNNINDWKNSLDSAKDFVEYFLQVFGSDLSGARDKSKLAESIIPLIYQLNDEVERGHYIVMLAEKLGVDEKFIMEKYNRYQPTEGYFKDNQIAQGMEGVILPEERLIGLIITFFKWLRSDISDLHYEYFSDSIKSILQLLADKAVESEYFDWKWFDALPKLQVDRLRMASMQAESDYIEIDEVMIREEYKMLLERIKLANKELTKESLEKQIGLAEGAGEREKVKEYIRKLQDLIIKDN